VDLDFDTKVFDKEHIAVADRREPIVRGGRRLFATGCRRRSTALARSA
jgi:hypothetical protein